MFRVFAQHPGRTASRHAAIILSVFMLLLLSASAHAEPRSEWLPSHPVKESKWRRAWKWSAAALIAGNALDVASSYGYRETNGVLRGGNGQLNQRGAAIKFGVMAGALLGQHYMLKQNPGMEKPLAITNFAVGAAFSGIAVRNWKVR